MRKFLLLLVAFLLSGCTAIEVPALSDDRGALTSINRVQIGMTESDVRTIMGDRLKIGYQETQPDSGIIENISIPSPYKTEDLKIKGKVYRILYYYTKVMKSDGLIADDELTPLIFQNNKLVGKGEDSIANLRRQLQ